jgi:hypothetical protein
MSHMTHQTDVTCGTCYVPVSHPMLHRLLGGLPAPPSVRFPAMNCTK